MKNSEKQKLVFKGQYVLSPEKILNPGFQFNELKLGFGNYSIYSHVDLEITTSKKQDLQIILLGEIFDFNNPKLDNQGILNSLLRLNNFKSVCEQIGNYTGCYVIFYCTPENLFAVTDFTATKKVFYHKREGEGIYCSSNPHLLAKGLRIELTNNISKLQYYQNKKNQDNNMLVISNIGRSTAYDSIRQLNMNSYLDVYTGKMVRFWPNRKLRRLSKGQVAKRSAKMIKGFMEAIAKRHHGKLMLPLTGGKDSRTLFAGLKDYIWDVFCYINKEERTPQTDIDIPKRILKSVGKEFHVLPLPSEEIDPDFRKVYFENNPFASRYYLKHFWNYFKNYPDYINLPGNIGTAGRGLYHSMRKATPENISKENNVLQYGDWPIREYSLWIEEVEPLCKKYGFNIWDLFYIEERLGNWGDN